MSVHLRLTALGYGRAYRLACGVERAPGSATLTSAAGIERITCGNCLRTKAYREARRG